ncbi:MAG: Nif3-like dinuclear metal center hexameric protein [Verrucomicrobia bacterium]|jgi:dinuclear metal center YbgI/SA1388 family protein|nr:Nif3-like dinuclear metal center hexameric protein [Verrucomicrobiota bacterium]
MASLALSTLTRYCDQLLRIREVPDYDGAVNGLQVERVGPVKRIAAAVDASFATVQMAAHAGADLLVVHHGLFWNTRQPWTGPHHRLLRLLVEGNLAVYSAHLPLDAHPQLGNNAQLCAALGFTRLKPFLPQRGAPIGLQTRTDLPLNQLSARLSHAVHGPVHVIPAGPKTCRRIGVVTGGAGGELRQAAAEGVDTFITGEGPHWTHALAEELGLNVLYGGHYATETFGVKALAEHLARRFKLSWTFLDHPTGL